MRLEFHPEAEWELIAAATYYEREVPGLGARFADEVGRVIDVLQEHPEIGARIEGDLRGLGLNRFLTH
jgi:toxin ParE1/3/4